MSHSDRPTVGFVLEQTLGHVTHAENLQAIISREDALRAVWRRVPWETSGPAAHLPGYGNWTVRAGLRARRAIGRAHRATPLDALFIHTQVPAILAPDWMRRIPTVVSVDATPEQYDELGAFYAHERAHPAIERVKWEANRRCFARAEHLVSWSAWAKSGLVDRYGVPPDKVTVIPPGVDAAGWAAPHRDGAGDGRVRILFVGGDLDRKGGRVLLDAFHRLRASRPHDDVELHLVTRTPLASADGVVVHHDMTPNSPELKALYHMADIFCLPTHGDSLGLALLEAGAAGLPLVSTDVGAISEIVEHGHNGFLVTRDDVDGLTRVLSTLVDDPELRRTLGADAAARVRDRFDAVANTHRLVDVLVDVAGGRTRTSRPRLVATLAPPTSAGADDHPRREVLLTVSGTIPADVAAQVADGKRPRPDYLVMAETLGADLLDHERAAVHGGPIGRMIGRVLGRDVLVGWTAFRVRHRYRVVFTDGEQVGLPFALLCRLAGRDGTRHVMIVHIMSVAKKALPFRALRLGTFIDTMVVYASAQKRFLEQRLGVPSSRIVLSPFMVDTDFFSPTAVERSTAEPMICSAGLEFRDYPTLIDAVRGLYVRVVLAAASPWSKRHDSTSGQDLPDNVEVCRLGFVDLRQLYADSLLVVMPLQEVPFQAGVTTILEAMAMGKAVICSRTTGQTDVVVDGETGLYVTPGDVEELRSAIIGLLEDPERARRMGAAGRALAEREMDVATYARDLADVVEAAGRRP